MLKKVLFSLSVLLLLSFSIHKYYVSITEAEYNATTEKFEMSIKFIGHDLEKALDNSGAPNLFLGTEKELEKANHYLESYVNQRFHMVVDGKSLNYKIIGKEVNNDDFIYCYLESDEVSNPNSITIKNTLLTEIFNEQANTVYLKVGNQKFNYSLNKSKVSDTHHIQK
ncbi:MAG: DUF6702 family protein [Vicingaceae bacterium]